MPCGQLHSALCPSKPRSSMRQYAAVAWERYQLLLGRCSRVHETLKRIGFCRKAPEQREPWGWVSLPRERCIIQLPNSHYSLAGLLSAGLFIMPKGVKLIPESLSISSCSSCRGDRVGFMCTGADQGGGHGWVDHMIMWAQLSRGLKNVTPVSKTCFA